MHKAKRVLWLLLILVMPGGGAAQPVDIPPAVGRISYGDTLVPGAAICTGVLVAADLVLTAAHCVRGAADDPSSIRFEAGWRNGHPAIQGRGGQGGSARIGGSGRGCCPGRAGPPHHGRDGLAAAARPPSEAPHEMHGFRRDDPGHPAPRRPARRWPRVPACWGWTVLSSRATQGPRFCSARRRAGRLWPSWWRRLQQGLSGLGRW